MNPLEKQRPLSPRLTIYRWQMPMLASLAHRASGMVLVLFVPFYLWLLHGMTGSPEEFDQILALLHSPFGKLTLWLAGTSFLYHFMNGIRFLLLDAGAGESRGMMNFSAKLVLGATMLAALVLGALLWL